MELLLLVASVEIQQVEFQIHVPRAQRRLQLTAWQLRRQGHDPSGLIQPCGSRQEVQPTYRPWPGPVRIPTLPPPLSWLHKMERWRGVLRASPTSTSQSFMNVAASLCFSPSSKTLAVPATNAVFFCGDRVEGTGNAVVEEMSDARNVVELLVSKFGGSVNAWVVEASAYNGPFAVYREFVPTVDSWGDPRGYVADGFPAASSIVALLSNCIVQVKDAISREQQVPLPSSSHSAPSASFLPPKTVIVGFSKSGIVLNQIVTELAHLDSASREATSGAAKSNEFSPAAERHVFISSSDAFLRSISQLHYVDVGLNTTGAYLTNHDVIKKIADYLHVESPGIRVVLHGTPRQWCDSRRPWIREEKDRMLEILEAEARKSDGKLETLETFKEKESVLQKKIDREAVRAQEFTKARQKQAAMQCLKRKKFYEAQMQKLGKFQSCIQDKEQKLQAKAPNV